MTGYCNRVWVCFLRGKEWMLNNPVRFSTIWIMRVTLTKLLECHGKNKHTNKNKQKPCSVRWECQIDKRHVRTAKDRKACSCQILHYYPLIYLKHSERNSRSPSCLLYIKMSLQISLSSTRLEQPTIAQKHPLSHSPLHQIISPKLPLSHSSCITNFAPQLPLSHSPCSTSKCPSTDPSQPPILYIQMSLLKSFPSSRPAVHRNVPPQLYLSHKTWKSNSRYTNPSKPTALLCIQMSLHNYFLATSLALHPTAAPQLILSRSPCCTYNCRSTATSQTLALL